MIGAGGHASRNVYPSFRFLRDAKVVANCDLDLDKARRLGLLHGITRSYESYLQMLDSEHPDGVIVCVGPDFHARVAVELMELGYPVYTEKPPAVNSEQCRQALEAHRRTGKICMTGFKKRYAPAYLRAKAIVDSEDFGAPTLFQFLRTSGNYSNTDNPRSQYLLDSAIHAIDLVHYFFGPVQTVMAHKRAPASFAISLGFANGAVGTLALTDRLSGARKWEQVTIVGDGSVCIQIDNSVGMLAFKRGQPCAAHKPDFVTGSSNSLTETGFVDELREFVNCIREGSIPRSSIESSYHTMCIMDAVRESSEMGYSVSL
jgi:predicted dehydrogenase